MGTRWMDLSLYVEQGTVVALTKEYVVGDRYPPIMHVTNNVEKVWVYASFFRLLDESEDPDFEYI